MTIQTNYAEQHPRKTRQALSFAFHSCPRRFFVSLWSAALTGIVSAVAPEKRVPPAPVSEQSPAALCLQGVSGVFASRRFAIDRDLCLGRNPKRNNLVFPSDYTKVSGIHCRILLERGDPYLEDLNSTNGTWYKDQRLIPGRKIPLKEGDTFRLGQHGDMFRIERSRHRPDNAESETR